MADAYPKAQPVDSPQVASHPGARKGILLSNGPRHVAEPDVEATSEDEKKRLVASPRSEVVTQQQQSPRSRCVLLKWLVGNISVEVMVFIWMLCYPWLSATLDSFYSYKVCQSVFESESVDCFHMVNNGTRGYFGSLNGVNETFVEAVDTWWYKRHSVSVVMSALVTLCLGMYTDNTGIRMPLVLPFIGQTFSCVYYAIMVQSEKVQVGYLLFGEVLSGLGGGIPTLMMASLSYLSKMTNPEFRTVRFVIVQAAMGLGLWISSVLMAAIYDRSTYTVNDLGIATCIGTSALSLLTVVYGMLRIVEYNLDRTTGWDRLRNFRVYKVFATAFQGFPSMLQSVIVLLWLVWISIGPVEILNLEMYLRNLQFTNFMLDSYMAYRTILQSMAAIGAIVILKSILDASDAYVARLGLLSGLIELIFLGSSYSTASTSGDSMMDIQLLMYLAPVGGMLRILGIGCLRALACELVEFTDDHGKLLAFMTSFECLLQFGMSVVYRTVFRNTQGTNPNTVFWISSVMTAVAVLLSWCVKNARQLRREEEDEAFRREISCCLNFDRPRSTKRIVVT